MIKVTSCHMECTRFNLDFSRINAYRRRMAINLRGRGSDSLAGTSEPGTKQNLGLDKVQVNYRHKFNVNTNSTLAKVGTSDPFWQDTNPVALGCVVGLWHGITEQRLPLSTINSMWVLGSHTINIPVFSVLRSIAPRPPTTKLGCVTRFFGKVVSVFSGRRGIGPLLAQGDMQ